MVQWASFKPARVGGFLLSSNRRISQRHDVTVPASLVLNGDVRDAMIENISLGGAQVEFPERLPMGQRVQLRFFIPNKEHAIEVGATVRWTSQTSLGLQFEGLRARDVWALNKYFETLE